MEHEQWICDVLSLTLAKYPPPMTFDLLEAVNPERAKKIWATLEANGYVTIKDSSLCGVERIPGQFVSLTDKGLEAANESDLGIKYELDQLQD